MFTLIWFFEMFVVFSDVFDIPHIIWMDNYSHQLRVHVPTAVSQQWRSCNWSVKAAITLTSLKERKEFMKAGAPDAIPALEELFSSEVTARFNKYYSEQENLSDLYFDLSISKDVRSIPIKLDSDTTQTVDFDRKFVPLGILEHNIGSNTGLFFLLQKWRIKELHKVHTPRRYW